MRRDLTGLIAWTMLAVLGTGQQAWADNWLRPKNLSPHARYTAAQNRQYPGGDPFVDDPTVEVTPGAGPELVHAPPAEGPYHHAQPSWLAEEFGIDPELLMPARFCGWYGGADYMHLRPSFSQAVAFVQIDDFGGDATETVVAYDFPYRGSLRSFIGYRFPDCKSQVQITYSNFRGQASQPSHSARLADPNRFILGQAKVPAARSGEVILSTATVDADTYDLAFSKTVCFDPIVACETDMCRPCGRWDVTWTIALRFADVRWDASSFVFQGDNPEVLARGANAMSFSGVGPNLGLRSDRYFGVGRFSLYGSGNIGLLAGNYNINSVQADHRTPNTTDALLEGPLTQTKHFAAPRMIPMMEMELGATWRATKRMTFTTGYLWQAYFDLGMSAEHFENLPRHDDANILAFDGWFFRGEWAF